MTTDSTRSPHRRPSALIVLAALALCAFLAPGSAVAAPANGTAVLELQPGKATTDLLTQGVHLSYKAKQGKTGSAKRSFARASGSKAANTLRLPVDSIVFGKVIELGVEGNLVFAHGKRKVTVRDVNLRVAAEQTSVVGKVGKRNLVVFRAEGESHPVANSVGLSKAPFALTGKAADALAPRLGLDSIKPGQLGQLSLSAVQDDLPKEEPKTEPAKKIDDGGLVVDPYAAQCALSVTSKGVSTAPGAAAVPSFAGSAVTGGKIDWGLRAGLRTYVVMSGGALIPIAPAEVLNPPLPAPQTGSFRFPASSGQFDVNDPTDPTDDQAVVNGTGEVVLCNSPHGFRITISNPTVVLDGASSRLIVDVDTNMSGVWTPTQRVDLATLDLDPATPFYNESAKTVTWSELPVTLTAAGEKALALCNPNMPGPCAYEAGDPMDSLTVELKTETAVTWAYTSACPVAGSTPVSSWPTTPARPLALPTLATPEASDEARVEWGLQNLLRGQIQTHGAFNVSGGATVSNPGAMSGPGKFFTWLSTDAVYDEANEKLIVRGTGSVGLCNNNHGYGTVLANPTVVLDGSSSRLTLDVHTRVGPTGWTSGRVDVANLDLTAVSKTVQADTPTVGEETITWSFLDPGVDDNPGTTGDNDTDSVNSPVTVATPGSKALWILGNFFRTPGTPLNSLRVSIVRD